MILLLEVINYKGSPLPAPISAEFDENGGTIGRKGNPLELPDAKKKISRIHGKIRHENGQFIYTDCLKEPGKLGTELCGKGRTLFGESTLLADGDCLKIGGYELQVRLLPSNGADAEPAATEPDAGHREHIPDWAKDLKQGGLATQTAKPGGRGDAPLARANSLKSGEPRAAAHLPPHPDGPDEFTRFPSLAELLPLIPKARPETPVFAGPQPSSPAAKPAQADLLDCFLQGAGLAAPGPADPAERAETLRVAGHLFRHMVGGMMAALQACRDAAPAWQGQGNPLQTSHCAEAAMAALLDRKCQDKGYLDPADCVEEGFASLRWHETALRQAAQTALKHTVRKLDPVRFGQTLVGGTPTPAQESQCWEAYCARYPLLADEAIRHLFGTALAQAYAEQMRQWNETRGA